MICMHAHDACSAGEPDVYHISFNGYMAWVEQCKLINKGVLAGELETIFTIVNAMDQTTAVDDRYNSRAALNRQEFLQVLI